MLFMFRITSSQRTKIVLLGVALVAVIAATAFGQIRLNAWNQPFYDALARKASHGFVVQAPLWQPGGGSGILDSTLSATGRGLQ
jgi:ABC-type uncharacterized transport system fused permease/ATPase subunit